jgi:succinoglycan biosynthesis transport protein ExoP
MTSEYELSFEDYLSILKRRWPFMVIAFLLVLITAMAAAVLIPPIYRSTGTIIVEAQGIPDELVSSTTKSYADERIQLIKQRVMTRDNLVRVIDKYRLYEASKSRIATSDLIDLMRNSIGVENIKASGRNQWQGSQTIAFKLYFEHGQPELAHKVANELVTLFLGENIKTRTQRASETTEFLSQEADKLKAELEKLEQQIAVYKQQNSHALPEHLNMRMSMISRAETDLRNLDLEYKSTQEELRFLDIELAAARAGIGEQSAASLDEDDLAGLQAEYFRLSSKYTDSHPDIRAIKRKLRALGADIPELEKRVASLKENNAEPFGMNNDSRNPIPVSKVLAKIESAKNRLSTLESDRKKLQTKITDYEKAVLQTPDVERGLTTLSRDHDNARRKYEEIRAKQMSAKISESLEGENKAERFTLLEPPLLPERAIKPNRKKIMALGFILAVVSAAGVVFVLETFDKRLRGSGALSSVTHETPLVVIPYIKTSEEVLRGKKLIRLLIAIALILAIVLFVLVHTLYMPLDIIFLKVIARFD